ncbi:MAG TPA: hypothetical protein VLM89_07110, partial [Phycisphaerae bacterium]|nr:hypothetical protein [Phycisphaerae bacterium]
IGFTQRFIDCLDDPRNPDQIDHPLDEMVRQRVYGSRKHANRSGYSPEKRGRCAPRSPSRPQDASPARRERAQGRSKAARGERKHAPATYYYRQ